ncbi:MAG: TMEM198/TM7SF3 family protein [Vicinamibacterales bacterium]|jgi:hypothetical protein|nr:TMEM198/TM7SF3 family protein [Vicinamibacterales bacterium]
MLPESLHDPVAYILLGGGLLACFLGHRLFRFVLAGYGLVFGVMVTVDFIGSVEPLALVGAVVGGAVVGGLVFFLAYFVGVTIVGAVLGAVIAIFVWTQPADDPQVLVVILFAIVGAFVALLLQRYVIIVGTAFFGALTSVISGLALFGDPETAAAVSNLSLSNLSYWFNYRLDREALLVWLAMGLFGVIVQFRKTGKARGRRRK